MKLRNKKEDLNIIKQAANLYEKNLNNKSIMFIYLDRNTNNIKEYEVMFRPTFFQHLTGTITKLSKRNFYTKALNNTLKVTDFEYKDDNTYLKLDNLVRGMEVNKYARMIGEFMTNKKYLTICKVAGTQYLSIGFDEAKKYNYPKTFLIGDIRKLTIGAPNRILCILSKNIDESKYENMVYSAKDIALDKLEMSEEIRNKIII